MLVQGFVATDAICNYSGDLSGRQRLTPQAIKALPGQLPLRWNHSEQIGTVTQLEWRGSKLWCQAELDTDRSIDNLYFSIGFKAHRGIHFPDYVEVTEARLTEVSITQEPANRDCRVELGRCLAPLPKQSAASAFHDALIAKTRKMEEITRCLASIQR